MKELIIGCGRAKEKKIISLNNDLLYHNPVTLDINPDHNPDFVWDLENLPMPFDNNEFDQIHAYEVLEHTGNQGDYKFFFAQFSEFWRILKKDGILCVSVPNYKSVWAFGDPSHKRIINEGSLVFLSQKNYINQVGKSAITDFRYIYSADFETVFKKTTDTTFYFILKVIKE